MSEAKERPIIFSGAMVRAIIGGSKTQTRRAIKPQPPLGCCYMINDNYSHALCFNELGTLCVPPMATSIDHRLICPYGKPGNRLWVRETWQHNPYGGIVYRATGGIIDCDGRGWKPSSRMPRKHSRITLEVTGVRVERLQDISESDAIAEGSYIDRCQCMPRNQDKTPLDSVFEQTGCHIHGTEFRIAWDSTNAKRGYGWESNPWVWVVEFERIKP